MTDSNYTGKEWADLLREMDGRQLKKSLRGALRAEAKKAQAIAQQRLETSGLRVKGSTADWKKGIRIRIYPWSKGTGFMITTKARAGSKSGRGEKGMHVNRWGKKKPVLMWAEDGTTTRRTKGGRLTWLLGGRKSHSTGRMRAYGFMEAAQPAMMTAVEQGLTPEVEKAVVKTARKCGFA